MMIDDDEILQTSFYGTNLHGDAVYRCHHPVRTDDGATAYVWIRIPQLYLKLKYALSLNGNEMDDWIFLTFHHDKNIQNVPQTSSKRCLLSWLV